MRGRLFRAFLPGLVLSLGLAFPPSTSAQEPDEDESYTEPEGEAPAPEPEPGRGPDKDSKRASEKDSERASEKDSKRASEKDSERASEKDSKRASEKDSKRASEPEKAPEKIVDRTPEEASTPTGAAQRTPAPPPPGRAADDVPTIRPDNSLRRAVRGAPVEPRAETETDALLRLAREFDEAAFPRPATLRPGARSGRPELPAELRTTPARGKAIGRPGPRPEELRPDLPWLKGLKTGDIPIRWDARVIRYLEFYKDDPRGRQIMTGWLKAQGRFRDLILDALRRHGLPEDLLYLSMIESGYNPRTVSRAQASGLWQFIARGAKIYGLRIDYWVDERNDPVKSTEAAMLYWKDLYARFGDWHLTLAAYNCGYGAVLSSMAKYNTNDFWRLLELEAGLPWESSIYVPKALAAMIVGHNREVFGYADVEEDPPFEYDTVTVPRSVTLQTIAKAAGVTVREIEALNPQLRRGRTPAGVPDYPVRIPRGKRETFARAFPQLRAEWDGWGEYVVRHGERLEDVATTFGLDLDGLAALNGIEHVTEVRGGVTLVVPRLDEATLRKNREAAERALYDSDFAPGAPDDPMIVAVPDKNFRVPGKKRVFYRVVAGDDLETVARVLGVSPGELAGWNGLDADAKIQPRMVLVAYVAPSFDPEAARVALLDETRLVVVTSGSEEHLDLVEGRKGRRRVKIVAKRGDTLESIGRRYRLTKYDLARINRRSYYTPLQPGEELIVYEIVDLKKAKAAGVKIQPERKARAAKKPGRAKSKPKLDKATVHKTRRR